MSEYEKPYGILFAAVLDALDELNRQNFGRATDILIKAQRDAEEAFLDWIPCDEQPELAE